MKEKKLKDIICYLKVLSNPADSIALFRIINVPKRVSVILLLKK